MSVIARHATPRDLPEIEALCEVESHILEKHWGPFTLGRLMERSALSCCAVDDRGSVVGFACFHHFPLMGDLKPATWIEDMCSLWRVQDFVDVNASNCIALNFFFAQHLHEEQALLETLKMALVTFTQVETIILLLPASVLLFRPLLGNFEPIPASDDGNREPLSLQAFMTGRQEVMGSMVVRNAMVEDHDDLVPVFRAQQVDAEQFGEFFLAQMIQAQDGGNRALVAESGGRAVGLLAMTAEVQLTALQEAFELEAFDFFVQGYAEEAERVRQAHIARTRKLREDHAQRSEQARAEAAQQVEEEFRQWLAEQKAQEEEEGHEEDEGKSEEERAAEAEEKAKNENDELQRLIQDAQEDAVAEIGDFEEEGEPAVDLEALESNAFCITLFCLDPQFDCQVHKLLEPAFELLPDKEYCLMSVPHTARRMSLLSLFLPVRHRLGHNFSHALYVCHKASLLSPIYVAPALEADRQDLADFLEDEEEPGVFLDPLSRPLTNPTRPPPVFIARVLGQLVAVALYEPAAQPALFHKFYQVEAFLDPGQYSPEEHGELKSIVVNPIFNNAVPAILQHIQRLAGTCCTYALLPPDIPTPDALQALTLVGIRARGPASFPSDIDPAKTGLTPALQMPAGPPTLLHTNFRLLCQPKKRLDTRIVVVGNSDTALALVHTLLAVPYLAFHRLFLVAPAGLPLSPPNFKVDGVNFTKEERLWHGIAGQGQVIAGELRSVDREHASLQVLRDDGQGEVAIHYDYLVIAPGLQDTLAERLVRRHLDKGGSPALKGLFSPDNPRHEPLLQDYVARVLSSGEEELRVCLVGNGASVLVAARRLQELGVDPRRMVVLCGEDKFEAVQGEERASELLLNAALNEGIEVRTAVRVEDLVTRQNRVTGVVVRGAGVKKREARAGEEEREEGEERGESEGGGGGRLEENSSTSFGGGGGEGGEEGAGEDGEVVLCGLLLTGGAKGVDPKLFLALNEQSLVFDGKLVVDASFTTNDPHILAGGDMVKFARRIQDDRRLENFNLREMGQVLGEAVLLRVDPESASEGPAPAAKVRALTEPLGYTGAVLGGLHVTAIEASPALFPLGSKGAMQLRDMVTEVGGAAGGGALSYTRLGADKYGRVSSICMVANEPLPEPAAFRALVGLPVAYLNDVVNRVDLGLITDLRDFLLEDWAAALFHDRFGGLREQLEQAAQTGPNMAALVETLWKKIKEGDDLACQVGMSETLLSGEAKEATQDGLNRFLELNASHLPAYLSAARAQDMQTTNVWAATAEKVGLVVGDVPEMADTM